MGPRTRICRGSPKRLSRPWRITSPIPPARGNITLVVTSRAVSALMCQRRAKFLLRVEEELGEPKIDRKAIDAGDPEVKMALVPFPKGNSALKIVQRTAWKGELPSSNILYILHCPYSEVYV